MNTAASPELSFLAGGGPTGELLRRHEWSATPLGPPAAWPQPLKTLLGVMLASNQPMLVAWGPQRTLLYNQPYTEVLADKHPAALGRDLLEVWGEIRPQLEPIVTLAYRGVPTQSDDIHLVLHRRGYPEDTHFAFFYSPVRDEQGQVAGLFCGCNETTAQVRAHDQARRSEERIRGIAAQAAASTERVQLALDAGAIIGTWVWDVTDDRFLADARFARSFGLDEDLCRTGLPLEQVMASIHPDDQPAVGAAVAAALERGGRYRYEYRVRQSDGIYRWVEANGHVETAADGRRRFPGVLLDIDARRRIEAERDQAHALLRTIMDAVPGVVYAKDLQGRLLVANRGTAELIGRPPEQFLGRTDLEFLDDKEQAAAVMANDGRVMDSGVAQQIEEEVRLADGTPALWLSTKAPIRDAAGRVVGLVGTSIDISERKRGEQSLRESDRRKSEFLAVLSHELRNPLAPIRNSLALLERSQPGGPTAQRALQVIGRQSAHLNRLVDDLLDLTRISSGKIELQRQRVDLRELVRRTLEDFQSQLAQAELQARLAVPPEPAWLDADETRISQVAGNLLHNAIKFTPPGGRIDIGVATRAGRVELRVADTGAGMDPDGIEAMFEPFAQGQQTLARSKGGLGLGLPLVRGLVQMHGGTVRASSGGAGTGAEFVVSLPLAGPAATEDAPRSAAAPATRRDVLIIEDNLDAARSLADLLEMEGHRVRLAASGREGLESARREPPDIVLCDIGLPDMEGYEVARGLRDELPVTLRLVALSGYAQAEDRRRSLEAGFDEHLAKPAPVEELLRLLG